MLFRTRISLDPVMNNKEITIEGLKNQLFRSENSLEAISLEAESTVLICNMHKIITVLSFFFVKRIPAGYSKIEYQNLVLTRHLQRILLTIV